ncbi:MAG TPA: hypothetical protein VFF06_05195 [Polyangia bacterium]|nr:hypothetical protein [Polyangia bacterium]
MRRTAALTLTLTFFLTLGLTHAGAARADNVSVGSITADGQTVRNLSCELESSGMLALLQVVGTLAKQKRALDACTPSGGAFLVKWAWADGKAASVEVTRSSASAKSACVAKALKLTRSDLTGSCQALVLVGKPDGAAKAADTLDAKN